MLLLEARTCHVFLGILEQEADFVSTLLETLCERLTYLYQRMVGTTVPKCHRLCASIMPFHGAKSSSSKLIADMIHATQIPGSTAQVRPILLYCT